MKICVLGLDGATPNVIFCEERLTNLRRLMDLGVYGRLAAELPVTRVPAWLCMAASQDPGSLGLYGVHNRCNHSYDKPKSASSISTDALTIWDHLNAEGKKAIIIGAPPNYPPRKINGISIGCSYTPDHMSEFAYPPSIAAKINELVGSYPVDVRKIQNKDQLRDEIFQMSRKQWQVVHWLLKEQDWDYFQYVDIGLDRVQHAFSNEFDPQHHREHNPYQYVIPDYYASLDEQVGLVMESLDSETVLLVMSAFGAQSLAGGFAMNQWLMEQGLLVLHEPVEEVTSLDDLRVNWAKTRAWSEGGYSASVFLNLQGREPQGIIPPSEYELFRDQLRSSLESLADDRGARLNAVAYEPKQLYRQTAGTAPDLIVQFGDSSWSAVGSIGHRSVYLRDAALPDTCNHNRNAVFALVAPSNPLTGEYEGARVLDMAPTLLHLAGFEIPKSMQGRSLVAGEKKSASVEPKIDEERLIRDRLAGLGYV